MSRKRIHRGGSVTVSVRCGEYIDTLLLKATARLCLASAVTIQSRSYIGPSPVNRLSSRPMALPPTESQISKSQVPSVFSYTMIRAVMYRSVPSRQVGKHHWLSSVNMLFTYRWLAFRLHRTERASYCPLSVYSLLSAIVGCSCERESYSHSSSTRYWILPLNK